MSQHDTTSSASQGTRLEDTEKPGDLVLPAQLVARFCGEAARGIRADPGTSTEGGITTSRGFCGYIGGRGDGMVTGFDEGYDWMDYLFSRGWRPLAEKGDWPFRIYMLWRHKGQKTVIAEYVEGDLTIWEFATPELMKTHYAGLSDCP